jgi:hypothetical protein
MSIQEPTQDPQDKAFGAAASRDQDLVDQLEREGVTEEDLADKPVRHPRAGGKAEPEDPGMRTGEQRATVNRAEDPPA